MIQSINSPFAGVPLDARNAMQNAATERLTATEVVKKESPIAAQLNDNARQLKVLEELVIHLAGKLQPITVISNKEPQPEKVPLPSVCMLQEELRAHNTTIKNVNERLATLIESVQL